MGAIRLLYGCHMAAIRTDRSEFWWLPYGSHMAVIWLSYEPTVANFGGCYMAAIWLPYGSYMTAIKKGARWQPYVDFLDV
jgi:hypothetical protein